jgi:hypothetical protein
VQLAEHFDCRSGWNEAAASPELTGWLAGWLEAHYQKEYVSRVS